MIIDIVQRRAQDLSNRKEIILYFLLSEKNKTTGAFVPSAPTLKLQLKLQPCFLIGEDIIELEKGVIIWLYKRKGARKTRTVLLKMLR